MPAPLLAVCSVAVLAYVFFGRLRGAFVALIAVTFLVPSGLTVPYTASAFPTIHRLVLAAFAVSMVRRVRRGEVAVDALRPTVVHFALLGLASMAFIVGVLFGDRDVAIQVSVHSWLFIFDQLVFFAVAVTAVRAINDMRWTAYVVIGIVSVTAGIALTEHVRRASYGRWFFENAEYQTPPPGSFPLETRGVQVRVRAAGDFALAYAWASVTMLPLVLGVAGALRRRWGFILPAAVMLSIVWSYSRSAYAGLGAALFVVLLGTRFHRRVLAFVAVGGMAALLVLGYQEVVRSTFDAPDTTGSTEVREERLPAVLDVPQARPYLGVGLAGLASRGFESTDASYLLIYAELGVVGLATFGLVILVMIRRVLPALRAPPGIERMIGAASIAGIVAGVIGAFAYDGFHVGSARHFWLCAALALVIAERNAPRRGGLPRPSARRVLLPVAGVAVGLWLLASWTPRTAATFKFNAIRTADVVVTQGDIDFVGRVLLNSACTAMRANAAAFPDVRFNCFDLRTGSGLGQYRLEAPDRATLSKAFFALARSGSVVRGFFPYLVSTDDRTIPTWVRTAPLWAGVSGFALALVIPPIRFSRGATRMRAPEPAAV